MKKLFTLLICISLTGFLQKAQAQCSVCTVDFTCDTVPPEPLSCPDTLYPDTAGQPYTMNLTFYLPDTFDITSPTNATLILQQMTVLGVTGLPPGLTWETFDHTGTSTLNFFPTASDSAQWMCAKICGTPLVPGLYTVNVSALATVDVISPNLGVQTSTENFTYQLLIYPDPSGNTAFTLSADEGCGDATINLAPVLQSGGDPLYEYEWIFVGNDTSYTEFDTVTYNSPGDYVITHTTTQLQYTIDSVKASVVSNDWCSGDIFESCGPLFPATPDMKFRINDGVSQQDSWVEEDHNPVWLNTNMPVNSTNIIIEFIETDGFLNNDDDMGSAVISITGTGAYTVDAGPGKTSATVYIGTSVFATLTDTDTVTIHPLPIPPLLISSVDSICDGDSIAVNAGSGYQTYQWFDNGSVITGANDSNIVVYATSNLTVEVTDSLGCSNLSDSLIATIVPNPPTPSVFNDFVTGALTSTTTSGFNHQWYYADGTPISGATSDVYQPTDTGFHYVVVWNDFGCVDTSDLVYVSKVIWPDAIAEINGLTSVKIIPNPINNGRFLLEFSSNSLTDGNVNGTIMDLQGREVHVFNINYLNDRQSDFIDVQHLSKGVYLLNLSNGKSVHSERLIIR
ncbi:MAG: T9SS type A sorting domain-containing protein [Flavobacteriales bacterium]|nr:T9SS type A sorting domain-containing protein [Flavobacteriales bacterium]